MTDPNQCHFCGEYVKDGCDLDGKRHWLSDCRPDLVEHEIGPLCTWHGLTYKDDRPVNRGRGDCYAYQAHDLDHTWTDQHIYFYDDGPMG